VLESESFTRIRSQICEILLPSYTPLDIAQIGTEFKEKFRYLPNLERRLRELVALGDVKKNPGKIPTYEMARRPKRIQSSLVG